MVVIFVFPYNWKHFYVSLFFLLFCVFVCVCACVYVEGIGVVEEVIEGLAVAKSANAAYVQSSGFEATRSPRWRKAGLESKWETQNTCNLLLFWELCVFLRPQFDLLLRKVAQG